METARGSAWMRSRETSAEAEKRLYCFDEDDLLTEHEIVCQRCGSSVAIIAEDGGRDDKRCTELGLPTQVELRLILSTEEGVHLSLQIHRISFTRLSADVRSASRENISYE